MEFNLFTEDDFVEKEIELLEPGDVQFTIVHAEEKISKVNKNPMIEMKMEVIDKNGKKDFVYDMLVFTEASKWKIKAVLYSIRSVEEVKNALIEGRVYTTDIIGYSGKGSIKVDEYVNSNQRTVKRMKFDRYYPLNEDKQKSDEPFFDDNLDDIQF